MSFITKLWLFLCTGADYRCNACNRTLVAGTNSVLFDIIISDDNILELDEEFMLSNISTFIPSSSSIRVIMGSPESTAVVIEDNDCKLYIHTLCYTVRKTHKIKIARYMQ